MELTGPVAEVSTALAGLFLASFLAATLLPGGSEAAFAALLALHPQLTVAALAVATAGNTLGGMSSYLAARFVPRKELPPRLALLQRHGSAALALAWLPLVGDALCVAAGVLRLPWLPCLLWMALGKGLRYAVIAWLVG